MASNLLAIALFHNVFNLFLENVEKQVNYGESSNMPNGRLEPSAQDELRKIGGMEIQDS